MLLTQDQKMIRDAVRAYVANEIAPKAAQWDRDGTFPAEALKGLAQLGCYGVAVPEQWGGAGLNYVSLALILEEVAAGDGATSTVISVNNCPVCSIMMAWANDAQKQRWLAPLARGEMLGAFCLTEPHVGSEAGGLRTTATRDGDHYVLNGTKQFITSGKNADVAIVMAVTDKAAGKRGISAFLVPTGTPGYVVAGIERKMGQHASDTAQIVFENCRVPAQNLLGEEGQGLKIALSGRRRAAASASPRRAWAWRVPPSRPRCAIRRSAWPSARRSSTTRRCSSGWPTWPRRSRPRGS